MLGKSRGEVRFSDYIVVVFYLPPTPRPVYQARSGRLHSCCSLLQVFLTTDYYFFFAVLRAVFLAALAFTVFFAAFLAGFFAAFFIAISRLSSSSVGSDCPVKACRNASHSRSLFVACLRLLTWRRVRSSERSLRT